jgi:hypothetical protein
MVPSAPPIFSPSFFLQHEEPASCPEFGYSIVKVGWREGGDLAADFACPDVCLLDLLE